MKQIWITRKGAPEVLEVREAPDPEPKRNEVRIRVKAAGINFADLSARLGLYPDAPPIPCVVGYEVSGLIDAVGSDVTTFQPGQRVFGMPRFGGYTDTLVLPAEQTFAMPEAMSFEEAAALPVAYLTAHHAMFFTGNLREGSTVLIHSLAGGVGMAALQLARTRNCTIIGTASPSKHAFLRAEGCQHPLDSGVDYVDSVRSIVGKRGVDLVLDPVGGRSWKDGYELLGPAGRLVVFGLSAAVSGKRRNLLVAAKEVLSSPRFGPMDLMDHNRTVTGVNMGHLFDRLDLLAPQFDALLQMYREGKIKPFVDKSFAFSEAAAAHHYIHDRKARGKVVLVP